MFDETLLTDVVMIDNTLQDMIFRVISRYAELAGRELAVDGATAYSMLDGAFERALLHHLAGLEDALPALRQRVATAMPMLLR